mmetsp:Transcript_42227/g.83136  ORF Transcript_42227/g.83136 Transcript_42227/m.83136 type:complete len:332 (+) Transcript_42227:853-1848(+)
MCARLGLPPRVHDGALAVAHHFKVPPPRLRVDGLPHRPQQLQALPARRVHELVAGPHKGADRGRGRVQVRHLVLVHDFPEPARGGVTRHPFKHHLGGPVEQGAVGHICVPRDPPAVGGAEEHVIAVGVERVLEGRRRVEHVPACGVEDAFGFPRAAGSVQDEARVLGVHPLRLRLARLSPHRRLPPLVSPFLHLHRRKALRGPQPTKHDGRVESAAQFVDQGHGVVQDLLQGDHLPAPHHPVLRDHHLGTRVHQPPRERLLAEAPKHHRVDRPDPRASEHGDAVLRHVRHEHPHPVALFHAFGSQRVGELVHLVHQLLVRVAIWLVRTFFV